MSGVVFTETKLKAFPLANLPQSETLKENKVKAMINLEQIESVKIHYINDPMEKFNNEHIKLKS